MANYVTTNSDGSIVNVYCDDPGYAPVPPAAIKITPADFDILLANDFPNCALINGVIVVNQVKLAAVNLMTAKAIKKAEIRTAFEIYSNENVIVSGITYQGGYDKAIRLDAAKRLAELAGFINTTFYDIANVGHTLTIAEADAVVLAVSQAFQTEFARKQSRMVAIDSAITVAEVNAIIY